MKRVAALLLLASAFPAQAHEGHEHGDAAEAAAALEPRVEFHSARIEGVVARGAEALLVYADDYASNAPLENLSVAVAVADRRIEAHPLGEGIYRLPLDLLPEEESLQLQLRGEGWQESFALQLPPAALQGEGAPRPRWPWALALVLAVSAGLVLLRRRRRRA